MDETTRQKILAYFNVSDPDDYSDDMLANMLDDEVADGKSQEAANINNAGVDAQLKYLGVD